MSAPDWPEWAEEGYPHIWLPYAQMQTQARPEAVVGGEGVRLRLADGRELVDGIASWWTACHGYNHPHIREAVTGQLERLPHVMLGGLVHEPALTLARRLAGLLPGSLDHVFFSESGSVSVEIAMKMAVQFWLNQGASMRSRFVAFRHGYHGDTFGAMSVCDPDEGMHSLFRGVLTLQYIIDLPRTEDDLAAFDALLADESGRVAAVIMEPLVQAAGGMKFHEPAVLAGIAKACERNEVLLILDEIATGFGRTGTMFACEQAGLVPDIVTVSKALTGGTLPLAATVASRRIFEGFLADDPDRALMHGPTYTGNALACAAANASLDLFETEDRLGQVAGIESQLDSQLAPCRDLAGVADVRIKGAIGVVELDRPFDLGDFRRRFIAKGTWIRPLGNVVYLMPPLVIGEEDLGLLTHAVVEVLSEWSKANA